MCWQEQVWSAIVSDDAKNTLIAAYTGVDLCDLCALEDVAETQLECSTVSWVYLHSSGYRV